MKRIFDRLHTASVFMVIVFLSLTPAVADDSGLTTDRGKIHITVEGFRDNTGVVRIALFRSGKGFPDKTEHAVWKGHLSIAERKASITLTEIEYGTYAASVYHDANNNGRLDKKWNLLPKEGFGTSQSTGEEKEGPKFHESSFDVKSDSVSVTVRLKYLHDR